MIVSAYQPFFAPHAGFFAKALRSDTLVLLDGVQFPQGTTWLTRNRFKNDQGTLWMTVPVWKKGLGLQAIREVRICNEGRWRRKHLRSLKTAYADAPFFMDHLPFLEEVFSRDRERLVDLNMDILRYLLDALDIRAEIRQQSDLGIEEKEPALTVRICEHLGASAFLVQSSARKYLDERGFERAGIRLRHFTPRAPTYPQLWGPFIGNLSAFDLLFNCGPTAEKILRRDLEKP